jgi:TPR repeat protein
LYQGVNVTVDPELKEKVLSGELFLFTCPHCGKKANLAMPLVYHDMERQVLIQLCHSEEEAKKYCLHDDDRDAMSEMAKEGYSFRVVVGLNALKEKILVFDAGLNDIVVELFKSIMLSSDDAEFDKIFFTRIEDDNLIFEGFKSKNWEGQVFAFPLEEFKKLEQDYLPLIHYDPESWLYIDDAFLNGLFFSGGEVDVHIKDGVIPPDASLDDIERCRQDAERGDCRAQYLLGDCYENGKVVKKDHAEAAKWFRKAAEQGHPKAQFELGSLYENGWGVEEDMQEAIKWLVMAAEQGVNEAAYDLALIHAHGDGVEQDLHEAAKWYQMAAERGYEDAQLMLGLLYCDDEGLNDPAEAAKWLRLAAEQGHDEAQFYLAELYACGEGVPEDRDEALKWYRKSAEQGNPDAEEALELYDD